MKPLTLAKPLLLLLVGLPGAGKSFFARQFSETFTAPMVSHNRIRHELFESPSYSKNEEDLVARLANQQLTELLKTRRTIIIDGGCNARVDRQELTQTAKKSGYSTLVVWVQTDPATCRQRSGKRSAKHPEDDYTAPLSPDAFDTLAKKLTPPTREDHIVISGKHLYASQAKAVLRKIALPHQAAVQAASRPDKPAGRTERERPIGNPRRIAPIRRPIIN